MTRIETARNNMTTGLNCAQSAVKAYAGEVAVTEKELVNLAVAFGGGFARYGLVCGAISGAAMIISAKFGAQKAEDLQYKDRIYALASELMERFKEKNGSFFCRELIGYDMKDPVQLQKAREAGVFTTQCLDYVQSAAEILEDILRREKAK